MLTYSQPLFVCLESEEVVIRHHRLRVASKRLPLTTHVDDKKNWQEGSLLTEQRLEESGLKDADDPLDGQSELFVLGPGQFGMVILE
jgi:hypothetical protein